MFKNYNFILDLVHAGSKLGVALIGYRYYPLINERHP